MLFMYLLSWLALVVQLSFFTIGIAAGLYYIAELVEEYTVVSKKIITWMTLAVMVIYILLIFFEDVGAMVIVGGLLSQVAHLLILNNFPFVDIWSLPFIAAVILFFVNHFFAFSFFAQYYYPLAETMGYFTICLWLVPFALFVSLSANENVLPTHSSPGFQDNLSSRDDTVLGSYLSKREKRYRLLSLFHYANEYIFPQRTKKMF